MPRIMGTSAELITSPCPSLICPCRSSFAFKTIINAILSHFHVFFKLLHCGHGFDNVTNCGASAKLNTGPCPKMICPCWTKFTPKTMKNTRLCCFHLFLILFKCGHGGDNVRNSGDQCWVDHWPIFEINLPCQSNITFKISYTPYYAVFTSLSHYFTVAMVIKMPRMVLTSSELITGTCLRFICPCQTNFNFKMIKYAILCCFHLFFKIILLWLWW